MHTQSMAGDLAANVQDVQPTIRDEALYTRDTVDQSWQPGKLLNVCTGKSSVWVGQPWISCSFPPRFLVGVEGGTRYPVILPPGFL